MYLISITLSLVSFFFFFFSSRRRHTRFDCDWSSDVCSSDLVVTEDLDGEGALRLTVPDPSLRDFVYGVRATRRTVPTFLVSEAASEQERRHVYEPITFFEDGRLGHDIQYLRSEEVRSEEHTSELQSQSNLVCRLLLEKKKKKQTD